MSLMTLSPVNIKDLNIEELYINSIVSECRQNVF
jgi:hypothetical protein